MQATIGDHLIVHGHKVGDIDRRGEVVECRGTDGAPPYVVRWESDGREGLFFPGSDTLIEPAKRKKKSR